MAEEHWLDDIIKSSVSQFKDPNFPTETEVSLALRRVQSARDAQNLAATNAGARGALSEAQSYLAGEATKSRVTPTPPGSGAFDLRTPTPTPISTPPRATFIGVQTNDEGKAVDALFNLEKEGHPLNNSTRGIQTLLDNGINTVEDESGKVSGLSEFLSNLKETGLNIPKNIGGVGGALLPPNISDLGNMYENSKMKNLGGA